VFVAAMFVHRDNLARALLGWDTYATLVASRITSASDLAGTFTEKLMDGRLVFGDFYRPVGNLFVALDLAVWGTQPFGHQLTSTLLFAAACTAVFVVVQQRRRGASIAPAAWAATLVVLHPASLSILPIVARRTETLMVVFVLAALAAAGWAGASERRRSAAAACFALLAIGSKEPGLVVLPLLFIDRVLAPGGAGALRVRLVAAARFVAPSVAVIAAFAVARTLVLGGIGGYYDAPEASYLVRLVGHAPDYISMVAVTGALDASALASPLALLSTAAVAIGCVALWQIRSSRADEAMAELRLPALGLAWAGFQLALASTAEKPEPRYVEGLVIGLSLVLAGFVDRGVVRRAEVRATAGARCRRANALLAAAALVAFTSLAGAPLWRGYPAFAEASATQTKELGDLEARVGAGPLEARGERIRLRKLEPSADRVVDHVWMLSPWGVQAWLELTFPGRVFEVERDRLRRPEPTHWPLVIVERTPTPGE